MSHQTNVTREMVMRAVLTTARWGAILNEQIDMADAAAVKQWGDRLHAANLAQTGAAYAIVRMLAGEMDIDLDKYWRGDHDH